MSEPTLGPDYLHAEALLDEGCYVQRAYEIESVHRKNTITNGRGELIEHPVVRFTNGTGLILGATNKRCAILQLGEANPKNWIGRELELRACYGSRWFGGKTAVRVVLEERVRKTHSIDDSDYGVDQTGQSLRTE